MSGTPVVSNSSALIALEQIGHLGLLHQLFSEIVIPPTVARETATSVALPDWIIQRALSQPIDPRVLTASLGPGESEAISLALEVAASWIILDDRPARRLAQSLGLPVVGTLGILSAARRRGLIGSLRPLIDALVDHGFHISPRLYDEILNEVGESG
jgi:uncharacterized protein